MSRPSLDLRVYTHRPSDPTFTHSPLLLAVGVGDGFEVVAGDAADDEAAGAAFVGSPAGAGVGTAPPVSVVPPWFPVVVPLAAAPLAEPDPADAEPPAAPPAYRPLGRPPGRPAARRRSPAGRAAR